MVRPRFAVRRLLAKGWQSRTPSTFHNPTLGMKVLRILLASAITRKLVVVFLDTSVAITNTPVVGEEVFVRPPSGMGSNDSVASASGPRWTVYRTLGESVERFMLHCSV